MSDDMIGHDHFESKAVQEANIVAHDDMAVHFDALDIQDGCSMFVDLETDYLER